MSSSERIHPTAIIESGARIDSQAHIGAYSIIGAEVRLGAVFVASHVVIRGDTRIGDGTRISPFTSIGEPPQISDYEDSTGRIEIGKNCVLREHVTVNSGSLKGDNVTRIEDDCFLMIGCHIAHDCRVGRGVIMANNSALAGHVEVGEHAVIGGLCGVYQWVRIGHHAMLGFMSAVDHDVVPYGVTQGERAHLQHFNWRKMSKEHRNDARHFFDELFKCEDRVWFQHIENLQKKYGNDAFRKDILDFISSSPRRGITLPKRVSKKEI